MGGFDSPDCVEYLEGFEDPSGPAIAALVLVILVIFAMAGLGAVVYLQSRQIAQLKKLLLPSWTNVSGSDIVCRTGPDMEKKAGKTIKAGETVAGVVEGEWLMTDAAPTTGWPTVLYLPVKHPTTGASLFTATPQLPASDGEAIATSQPPTSGPVESQTTDWTNVSGSSVVCRTGMYMAMKADKAIKAGETVAGVVKGEWLQTDDGFYLPVRHPTTGAALFTATPQLPTNEAIEEV